jgi:hypothetical protein
MGIAGSSDIFQAKMSKLMVALEFVRTYLDDLLCITKAHMDDHLHHLRLVLTRLQEAGLRIKAPKSKFCDIETEHLGYILTRTGINPQPNKVQESSQLHHQNKSKTSACSWAWSSTIKIFGQDVVKCLPHTLLWQENVAIPSH